MKRLLLVTLLAGCGQTDARLYVDQDGALYDLGPSETDTEDTSRVDVAVDVVEEDAGDITEEDSSDTADTAPADVGEEDTEPDSSEFGPACAEIQPALEFGSRIFGEAHEEIIRVRNCGDFDAENLIIEAVAIANDETVTSDPEFELSGIPDLPFALLPNEAWPFPVRYSPEGPGEHTAVVRFTTNAPEAETVDVQVTASVLE